MPTRILVFGANGVFGRRTLRRLSLIKNLELRAVCRSQGQADLLAATFGPRIIPLQGNVDNLSEVRTLSQGVDAIFHCAGPFSKQPLHPLTVALENGTDYADLGDDPTYLKTTARLIASATRNDRLTICGASSLPSMTSLLAHLAQDDLERSTKSTFMCLLVIATPKDGVQSSTLSTPYATPFSRRKGVGNLIESPGLIFITFKTR